MRPKIPGENVGPIPPLHPRRLQVFKRTTRTPSSFVSVVPSTSDCPFSSMFVHQKVTSWPASASALALSRATRTDPPR
jgi:hypothetical protein